MKSVIRLTDRPDMTLDVYRGRKTTVQPSLFLLQYIAQTLSWIVTNQSCFSEVDLLKFSRWYEGKSTSNQPISFPMDRGGHDFHVLF